MVAVATILRIAKLQRVQLCPIGNVAVGRPVGFSRTTEARMKHSQLKVVIVALGLAIPVAANAQTPPKTAQAYCSMLSREYDRYISGNNEYNYLAAPGYGKAACKEHHARAAIPPLERTLRQAKLPLPTTPSSVAALPPGLTRSGG
jgi:hypothetical protein